MKRRELPGRRAVLVRRQPMPRGGWRRPKRQLPVDVDQLALLVARSLGWCEVSTPDCTPWASRVHRRRVDDRDRLSNLLHVCRRCQAWIGADLLRAESLGLLLHRSQEPTAEIVWYRADPVYLDDAGGVHPVQTAATPHDPHRRRLTP